MFEDSGTSCTRKQRHRHQYSWYPPGLRWWNFVIVVLFCWGIIAVLQFYLHVSHTQGGILFAADINNLPLRRTFWHLYLPTIIAVLFSVFIVWIDHDAKRWEPYRQLAQTNGAKGRDSVLLQYPFDFAPIVPFFAARKRHWIVFWASFATVMTTFGIVPLQAGIFSTRQTTLIHPQDFAISNKFIHSSLQEQRLTLGYTRSAYGVSMLNETLPAFTGRNYTLKPFGLFDLGGQSNENEYWTAESTLYSMQLQCEVPQPAGSRNRTWIREYSRIDPATNETDSWNRTRNSYSNTGFESSAGCYVNSAYNTNHTFSELNYSPRKDYFGFYRGYYTPNNGVFVRGLKAPNLADDIWCGDKGNRTFFATFSRYKRKKNDPPNNLTAIFCTPSYYEQDVVATVDAVSRHPKAVRLQGVRRPLSADIFNTTVFEDVVASAVRQVQIGEESLPGNQFPDCAGQLYDTSFDTTSGSEPITNMVVAMNKHRLQDLQDPESLAAAYESAYQLLFAGSMTEILKTDFSDTTSAGSGIREARLEAVVLEPLFTHLVTGFLAVVSVAMMISLYLCIVDQSKQIFPDDPASIAGTMSVVADDPRTLSLFSDLEMTPIKAFRHKLRRRRFKLGTDASTSCMTTEEEPQLQTLEPEHTSNNEVAKLERPLEFGATIAISFISLFTVLLVVLAVLHAKSRPYGLPMISKSQIVQNLVTKYLPTAIATLIEPMWILINRLLCALQPLEQMRGSGAPASRSISLRYGSLPPQLTLFKAFRAGHQLLAAVCGMSLLANLLATSFAGLFFSSMIGLHHPAIFSPLYQAKFVPINGDIGPVVSGGNTFNVSGAYQGSPAEDQFMILESNITRNTSLPAWIDDKAMYLPFEGFAESTRGTYQARTRYFTAEPKCRPLQFGKDYNLRLWPGTDMGLPYGLNVTVTAPNGTQIICNGKNADAFAANYGANNYWHSAFGGVLCRNGSTAAELVTTLLADPRLRDTVPEDKAICRMHFVVGWMRTHQAYCNPIATPCVEEYPQAPLLRRDEVFIKGGVSPCYGTGADSRNMTPPAGYEGPTEDNTFLMLCQPEFRTGEATVHVDSTGLLQEPAKDLVPDADQSPSALNKYFSNGTANLIAQSNLFLLRSIQPAFHNDSFASEFIHYFINRAEGSLRLTDPNTPLPTFADVETPMNKAYAQLFAAWLGFNKELLLIPAANDTNTAQILGSIIIPEERLFFVQPLLVISEVILGIYIVVSILVYVYRPGKYLPRLPTSLAAIIALFASSTAVKDLEGTSHMTNKERESFLNDLDHKYGYGSYIGRDGAVHVGIEKAPYVRYMKEVTFAGIRRRRKEGAREPESAVSSTEYVNVSPKDPDDGRSKKQPAPVVTVAALSPAEEDAALGTR